jgi:hypothetical protein
MHRKKLLQAWEGLQVSALNTHVDWSRGGGGGGVGANTTSKGY